MDDLRIAVPAQTLQYIKYDIIEASKWYIKPILASRLISADIYDISVSAEAILYLRYYWVGPPYIIYDIVGVGPSVPYNICDITGWAHHI